MDDVITLRAFADNFIYLWVFDQDKALVVDPGDAEVVLDELEGRPCVWRRCWPRIITPITQVASGNSRNERSPRSSGRNANAFPWSITSRRTAKSCNSGRIRFKS